MEHASRWERRYLVPLRSTAHLRIGDSRSGTKYGGWSVSGTSTAGLLEGGEEEEAGGHGAAESHRETAAVCEKGLAAHRNSC